MRRPVHRAFHAERLWFLQTSGGALAFREPFLHLK